MAALSHVFPQETHPFPRHELRDRWRREIEDPAIAAYLATDADGGVVGFAARRGVELLHFGTALETWGSGLADWLHDQLLTTYPAEADPLRLRVFAENPRARRFYEKLGWQATGRSPGSRGAPSRPIRSSSSTRWPALIARRAEVGPHWCGRMASWRSTSPATTPPTRS